MVKYSSLTFQLNSSLGNANLVYTIIRKRQVFFALSNLSTDTQTITKLNTKNLNIVTSTSTKKIPDKQTIFQTNSKSTTDEEPPLNQEIAQQLNNNNLPGIITNSVITTLAETPCKEIISN
jgi:hypothetical protein